MVVGLAFAIVMGVQDVPALPGPRECLDDNHTNRCLPEVQAEVRDRFGVAAIEAEAESGAEVYRAFYVDGYGNDMPVVAFERRPGGQGPEAVVYGTGGRTMRAAVSGRVWNRVIERARFADRRLEPVTSQSSTVPQMPPLCLHSWVQTVEMANSRTDRWSVEPVRRRTEDACGGQLTTEFAFFLADEAVKAIPPCEDIDETQTRNRITQLAACMNLRGDRLAAASLMGARGNFGPRYGMDPTNANVWRAVIGTNGSPKLIWGGEVVQTERGQNNRVAEFIAARLTEIPRLRFQQRTFEGRSSREGVIEGQAYYPDGDDGMAARYTQTWVWDPNLSEWMLSEWIVQPFERVD